MGGGAFQYKNGTSMAAPYVSGLAALIWSFDSTLTMFQVKDIILKSVDKKESLEGKILTGGRINAFNALYYVPSGPCFPQRLCSRPLARSIFLDRQFTQRIRFLCRKEDGSEWNLRANRYP
jgi:hypothetical protein